MKYCCCSVTQLYQTLCNPMKCNIPGFPVVDHLPELVQTHVHWVSGAIQPSYPLLYPSPPAFLQSFPASGSFPMSRLFTSDGQSIGASASASVLPGNIQGWFPLGLVLKSLLQHHKSKTSILQHSVCELYHSEAFPTQKTYFI